MNTDSEALLSSEMVLSVKDWRKALRTPPAYRVRNNAFRMQTKFVTVMAIAGFLLLLLMYIYPKNSSNNNTFSCSVHRPYNSTYPLSAPIISGGMKTFRIGVIADLDLESKSSIEKNTWYSYMRKGYLSYNEATRKVVVSWDKGENIQLKASYALKGRGMELSELVVFDGRLLTVDDRTGIVYEIVKDKILPWLLLLDGDGRSGKGFKAEWATVKDKVLYMGSMGKEWTTPMGEFVNNDPQYVKAISVSGEIQHLNWVKEYESIREQLDIRWPGYMLHESAAWSPVHQRWFFLPRRCSKQRYNETRDEVMGCNVLISVDPSFSDFDVRQVGEHKPTHGFSSFKFIPGSNDEVIVALKTEEFNGETATYITAFSIDGTQLMPESKISNLKFEGFEFI